MIDKSFVLGKCRSFRVEKPGDRVIAPKKPKELMLKQT